MKRKSGRPSSSGGAVSKAAKGQELWRPGVKTGLGPGKQVFIALPKARGEGGVRYQDGRIHPNTMLFLGELKANNDREWLKGKSCWYLLGDEVWMVEGLQGEENREAGSLNCRTI